MLVWIPSSPAGLQQCQLLGDRVPPVPALCHVPLVAEALHQHDPGARDADRVPAGLGRLAGETVAGQRRDDEVEGVSGAGAVGGRIRQRLDDLELLDRRSRPAVGDDERQRVLVRRANVDEVDLDAVDLGDEVRQGREPLLEGAPVVSGRPVASERLDRVQVHALHRIRLAIGPPGRFDPAAQVGQVLVGDFESELADRLRTGRDAGRRMRR